MSLADARDAPDRDAPAGRATRGRPGASPAVTISSPTLMLSVLAHAVSTSESPVCPCSTMPAAPVREVDGGDGARRVGEQRHARAARGDARDEADEPSPVTTGAFCSIAVVRADRRPRSPARRRSRLGGRPRRPRSRSRSGSAGSSRVVQQPRQRRRSAAPPTRSGSPAGAAAGSPPAAGRRRRARRRGRRSSRRRRGTGRATRSTATSNGWSAVATALLHGVQRAALRLAERERDQGEREQRRGRPARCRRRSALLVREGKRSGAGRRTGKPSTADLAVRLRGTSGCQSSGLRRSAARAGERA